MRTSDCTGPKPNRSKFAFLTARPLSLIDPILPLGVGFALVDDTGRVLFHSDKYRNNRENILVETSNDPELTASLYGHSNQENFSLDYRGNEVRARVVPVLGVAQSPWSLIVFKDARYVQTYDLEALTMAGALLIGYMGLPASIAFLFYFLVRPVYVPAWLWPSESAGRIYRFQIEAGVVILALAAVLVFLRPIEESLYAAAAAGYVMLIIVFWSTLSDKPSSLSKTLFEGICGLAAVVMVAFPLWNRWWWSVPIGLILFPFAWTLRSRGHLAAARRPFPKLSYRSLYNIRALVLLAVVGILPPLSFFQNSKRLEDRLHIRAAQLHAAMAWNSRERTIEGLDKEVSLVGPNGKSARCGTAWDVYLHSYFDTKVERQHSVAHLPSDDLDARFLRIAHFFHHSFNQIGAEALGVLRNPLPENVFTSKSLSKSGKSSPSDQAQGDLAEWEWEWAKATDRHRPLHLRLHEGADASNTCAVPDKSDSHQSPKSDLVVSSAVPARVSAGADVFTWLAVTAVMSLLFRLVTPKIFLFDLGEPLSQSEEELREALKGEGNLLVFVAPRQDWSPELAGGDASRIDIRELAAKPLWGERFDETMLRAGGTVVVENFDWEMGSSEFNRQRLVLAERLVALSRKVVFVSAVDPSPFLIDQCGSEAAGDADRWATVLGAFRRINLGHRSSWVLGKQIGKELPALWRECSVQPELYRIGEDLWHARNPHQAFEPEQVVSEVGERAAHYYYLEWRSCTQEECFVLAGLSRDGVVNPWNTASLRQLLRRRLIVRAPVFRIMNESFRRFVLAHAVSMQEEWDAEAAGSGWGKARGPFATALVLVGLFLLATQQQFLQTSSGMLAAAGGSVAALLKLVGVAQGRGSDT